MFYQLRPAGNPLTLRKSGESLTKLGKIFKTSGFQLYGSGTSALTAAIQAVIAAKGVGKPEVVMPAYTCPELVSAILFAGAEPILVDLEYKRPWINLEELKNKITTRTVAIIAVNLFGIPERFDKLKAIIGDRGIVLIEDSAQYFPASERDVHWRGDLTILSFGRGKPVSLLGGGAVICSDRNIYQYLPTLNSSVTKFDFIDDWVFQLKAIAYNILLMPRLYWFPETLPFLHLGETLFHPLASIEPFPSERLAYLSENMNAYWARQRHSAVTLSQLMTSFKSTGLMDLPTLCCGNVLPPLIRYPILAATKIQADKISADSRRHGLGVSRMYQKPLNEIDGLTNKFADQGPFPNSKEFAELLLTFPTHSGVFSNYAAEWEKLMPIEI